MLGGDGKLDWIQQGRLGLCVELGAAAKGILGAAGIRALIDDGRKLDLVQLGLGCLELGAAAIGIVSAAGIGIRVLHVLGSRKLDAVNLSSFVFGYRCLGGGVDHREGSRRGNQKEEARGDGKETVRVHDSILLTGEGNEKFGFRTVQKEKAVNFAGVGEENRNRPGSVTLKKPYKRPMSRDLANEQAVLPRSYLEIRPVRVSVDLYAFW